VPQYHKQPEPWIYILKIRIQHEDRDYTGHRTLFHCLSIHLQIFPKLFVCVRWNVREGTHFFEHFYTVARFYVALQWFRNILMTPKIKSHEIPYATIAEFVLQYLKNMKNMKWSIFSYSFPENLSEPSYNLFSRRYFCYIWIRNIWKIYLLLRLIVSPQLVENG
jgi:hypothetical protein